MGRPDYVLVVRLVVRPRATAELSSRSRGPWSDVGPQTLEPVVIATVEGKRLPRIDVRSRV